MTVDVSVEACTTAGGKGLCVQCSRCGHQVKVRGQTDTVAVRGTVVLRQTCPRRENNYYVIREDRRGGKKQPQEIARG